MAFPAASCAQAFFNRDGGATVIEAFVDKLGDGNEGNDFFQNKVTTGRYFMERVMPETAAHLARISSGAETMMALPAEAF